MRLPSRPVVWLTVAIAGWLVSAVVAQNAPLPPHAFAIGQEDFLLDGKPFVIRGGELHFPRIPRDHWEHRLKMARAMGLNAVCVSLFWNYHEWDEGKFDWKGEKDAAEFCRMAQKEGLWVILRPGPYSCAEWEMGGLPWWLLKGDGGLPQDRLRTNSPRFMTAASRYLKEVGRVLGPMQITHGGPILMVQVENEYGSYGRDAAYMGAMRQTLLDAGFNVPLSAGNQPADVANGYRDDLFQVVNFGSGPETAFNTLRKYQKTGPLMSGEFYPGWFDHWGQAHHRGDTGRYLADLKFMLDHRHSFSIHMAHGGTTFGLWAGADRPFQPDTSSYDYDAPISEAGWATEKFTKTRELFAKYLQPGETIPEPPAANPAVAIAPFTFARTADLVSAGAYRSVVDEEPPSLEECDEGRGCIRYDGHLPAGPAGTLSVGEVHDFAWVYLDGKLCPEVMDRRSKQYSVQVPAHKEASVIILAEAMGRVNFGQEAADLKGIHYGITFVPSDGGKAAEVTHWLALPIALKDEVVTRIPQPKPGGKPLDTAPASLTVHRQKSSSGERAAATETTAPPAEQPSPEPFPKPDAAGEKASSGPGGFFWHGTFAVESPGDTFLDLRGWGKGVVWVNGHCLGRYWNIGPTQTMYLPGPWMKAGANEIIVLDMVGPREAAMSGLKRPILDELHAELDFAHQTRAAGTFTTDGATVTATGKFTPAVEWQEVKFEKPVKGRYFCLEAQSTFDPQRGGATIAELDAVGTDGKSLIKDWWKILWVSSEETAAEPGEAENALDGRSATGWHTRDQPELPPFSAPHRGGHG